MCLLGKYIIDWEAAAQVQRNSLDVILKKHNIVNDGSNMILNLEPMFVIWTHIRSPGRHLKDCIARLGTNKYTICYSIAFKI